MGFILAIDQGWSKIYHVTGNAHIGLVDEVRGRFNNEPNKTNQICLRVPDVNAWHQYLKGKRGYKSYCYQGKPGIKNQGICPLMIQEVMNWKFKRLLDKLFNM